MLGGVVEICKLNYFAWCNHPGAKCVSCRDPSPPHKNTDRSKRDRSSSYVIKMAQAYSQVAENPSAQLHSKDPALSGSRREGLKGTEPWAAIAGLLWQLPLSARGSEGETSGPVIVDLGVMESGPQ
ncbi:hypothetical protein NPIL_300471 [Nephila pilipes]|uniref:Uncharacterized protein n=1 Tax=Nephila pilipes TaxID=299642 RepID=A0A8X6QPA0_NEPPI|nr:hypothetical protein NPIL_300471 [Nephila pilipes]